ncbi:MAG: hypothetical protein HDR09_05280 [Lachnospiraceae bacterium]|nr:hypothetical protein [Lachnospiraceae bacterium]
MKKKMLITVIIITAVIIVILAGWYVMFVHFGRGPAFPFLKTVEMGEDQMQSMQIAENPLIAVVATQKEAEEIAEQYGIILVSYENGIAVYQTEEDPYDVIARGQENGYHELSVNFIRRIE